MTICSEEKLRRKLLSRREFAKSAAMAATSAALLPGRISASTAQQGEAAGNIAAEQENSKLTPESQAEVEAKIEAVMRTRGSRLNDEQKKDIRRLITEAQPSLERLRAFALTNADQPALVLKVDPAVRLAGVPAPRAAER